MSIDENAAFVLSARNLSLAHQAGDRDLVVPCTACYLVLKKTQEYVKKYPEIQSVVGASLQSANLPPLGPVRVRHPLAVLFSDVGLQKIRSKVVRQWSGGKFACYYGCQALRPYSETDQPFNPMRMDDLLRAIGVTTVEYPLKTKCCGGSLTGTIHPVGVRLNELLLREAVRKGAEGIATMCSLCQFNLEAYQSEIRKQTHATLDLPVLYFTQILGWALGGSIEELGLHRAISGRAAIREWFSVRQEVEAHV